MADNNSMNIDVNQFNTTNNRASSLKDSIARDPNDAQLRESCMEFEAMFVKQMMDSMNKTINKSGFIKENMGEEIFTDMLNDEYSKKIADTSGFGIADMMYKQLAAKKYE